MATTVSKEDLQTMREDCRGNKREGSGEGFEPFTPDEVKAFVSEAERGEEGV